MRYHLEKQTRIYDGHTYEGPSWPVREGKGECAADTIEDALKIQEELQERNPVGWNIWDSTTDELVDGTDFFCQTGEMITRVAKAES